MIFILPNGSSLSTCHRGVTDTMTLVLCGYLTVTRVNCFSVRDPFTVVTMRSHTKPHAYIHARQQS